MSNGSLHRRYSAAASAVRRSWPSSLRAHCVLLATFTLLFGLQVFRVYLPTVLWYLGQFLDAEYLALYGLATFSLVLLAWQWQVIFHQSQWKF